MSRVFRYSFYQGRRDLEAKEALPQGPPKNRAPPPENRGPEILLFVLNFQFDY